LANRVWLITGVSSGFGKAFAEYAIKAGDCVAAAARTVDKVKELVALAPERVLPVEMDVTDGGSVEAGVKQAVERFGRIDVLVNNAGYGIVGAVEETPGDELRAQMETNFFGAVAVTRAVLPVMRAQRSGAIANMSSMGGQMSFPGFGAYSASKFALEGMSEALAQEVKPFGVKVIIVEPGQFRTGFAGSALKQMPEMKEYAQTSGKTREFAMAMDNTQAGDPYKAAEALDEALKAEETPLRLQLGEDAIQGVEGHAKTLLGDLDRWRAVGLATAITK
jgi:NAD(P)-dependent dehydrogenase (short-subunit alcohol dehydrogenase family)